MLWLSLSAIDAINNTSNIEHYTSHARNLLQKFPNKFKLLWIAGDIKIPGNELADTLAKDATEQPLITIENLNTKDILKYIKNEDISLVPVN